jgi:hypothetical protein
VDDIKDEGSRDENNSLQRLIDELKQLKTVWDNHLK